MPTARSPERATARSVAKIAIAVIAIVLVVRGVAYFAVDLRPADRVSLGGSSWRIAELDGQALNSDLQLSFNSDWHGTVASRCFRLRFEYGLESDDIDFDFFGFAAPDVGCPDEAGTEATIRSVLDRIQSWTASSNSRIEFYVGQGLPLFSRPLLIATK